MCNVSFTQCLRKGKQRHKIIECMKINLRCFDRNICGCLLVCIAIVTVFPQIVTILPDLVMGKEK